MGRSSLLGTDPVAAEPSGRDNATLGPGDTSDSGSDMSGIADDDSIDIIDRDVPDPSVPVDVQMRDEVLDAIRHDDDGEDHGGAGGGSREAADIGVDQVFDVDGGPAALDGQRQASFAFVEEAEASDPLEDEEAGEDS